MDEGDYKRVHGLFKQESQIRLLFLLGVGQNDALSHPAEHKVSALYTKKRYLVELKSEAVNKYQNQNINYALRREEDS